MKLESKTIAVSDVRPECAAEMLSLMRAHYEGVSEEQFLADLQAKQWVILLYGFCFRATPSSTNTIGVRWPCR